MQRDHDDGRPSPDALLEAAARETRSRLKIFVGAAPGVGKTFAMLTAARERRREGLDVVVGVVETHGRSDTAALLDGLEIVPRRRDDYRGHVLEEMDLDAILARRPALVLVDELAHTNGPGSRHPKRWADVEELLAAGIDVYTTVNIQHLESLNDVVAQITGVRVRETVPDRLLDRADEVQLIDLSPEELLQRLREGKVYIPHQAERAIQHFFQPGKLTALRELALRETAEHVDDQVRAWRRSHAVPGAWAVTDRLLVAVDAGPHAERVVRAGRRMADRRGAPWIALLVETPRFLRASDAERERVMRAVRLAEQLGAEVVTVPGEDVAEEILRTARERDVTEIVMGAPHGRWWRRMASPAARVVERAAGIDVRIVSADEAGAAEASRLPRARPHVAPRAWLTAVAAVAGATAVAAAVMRVLPLDDPGMIFLTGVLVAAVGGGLWPSILAAILSLLVYDFFFVEPTWTFTVTKPQDVLSLGTFLLVAILTSQLMTRVRDQAAIARHREARTAALFAFTREIAAAATLEDLQRVIVQHVAGLVGGRAVLLLPDAGVLAARAEHPVGPALPEAERGAATWVWQHRRPAGRGTDTLPGNEWYHLPLSTVRGAVGVLALQVGDGTDALPPDQRELLEALARQAAVGVERARIDEVRAEQAKTEAVIESIEDGLVVLDPAGVVVHVNEVACAILEVPREEALGRPFAALGTMHPHYLRLRAAVAEELAHPEREPQPVELALFLRGRDHFYLLRPTPWRGRDGTPAGLILVLQDVTHLRDQEARREQLIATLSHELRTPLTSLRLGVELLERARRDGGDDTGLLDAVRVDVVRLEDVAQRLLDLSRSRAMTIPLEHETVDARTLADRVAGLFALQARDRGVRIATRLPDAALPVTGDATKLSWALSNLVGNALRYTPRDGCITVGAEAVDGQVRLSVEDTGPGIPPAQRERIFERFVQGPEPGAAGLGLAIVRDIVQAHGGRIALDSEEGRGSRFTLDLPAG